MCNYLFKNVSGIFKEEFREIINKLDPVDVGEVVGKHTDEDVDTNGVELDEDGNVRCDEAIVVNRQASLFGVKVWDNAIDEFVDSFAEKSADPAKTIQNKVENVVGEALKSEDLGKQARTKIARVAGEKIAREIESSQQQFNIENAKAKVQLKREIADAKLDEKAIEEARKKFAHNFEQNQEKFIYEVTNTLTEKLPEIEFETAKSVVENEENAKKKKSEDDTRARLRGFARTIPSFLMAYGSDDTCLANFDEIVDADVFEEVTGITVDDFRVLRDEGHFFDEVVFNEACREFLSRKEKLSNYFETTATEDIFDYIPPQKTNQIFTPRPVVTKMLDLLEAENPGIFADPTKTFADLYVKSGLYLTEIAKRLFKGLKDEITDEQARLKHIFENQLFGFAPTPIIFNIAKNYVFGFEGAENLDTSNLIQLDLTPFAIGEEELPEGVHMKFDCIVGNPPYDETKGGTKKIDIWPHFEKLATKNSDLTCLIHPARWIVPKKQFKKIKEQMIDDGLKRFDYYPDSGELFGNVGADAGISITYYDSKNGSPIMMQLRGGSLKEYKPDDIFMINEFESEVFEKITSKYLGATIEHRIIGNIGSIGGSEFGYSKTKSVDKLTDDSSTLKNPVEIWANSGFGKGTRFAWHFIDESELSYVPEELKKSRKVMIDKKGHAITGNKGANIFNNIPQICSASAIASGDVLFVIPENDTDRDLELIKSYFMTKTIRFLMSIKQKDLYVRGFENVPDYICFDDLKNNELFTDDYFFKKFNISEECQKHINTCISDKS